MRGEAFLREGLNLGVHSFCVHRGERFVHPRLRLFIPLSDCLPQSVRLVELLLGFGEILVAVIFSSF